MGAWPPGLLAPSWEPSGTTLRPKREPCLELQIPLETFLHGGMHCKSFIRLGEDSHGIETIWDLKKC